MTRTKVDVGEEFDEEMKERLKELGYIGGGHVYKFLTVRMDLDSILDDIEGNTGLRFRGGENGHASLTRNTLRITSKEELRGSELEKIEEVC